ncbi:MAG: hypothetical protein Q8Q94_03750 [bacterium]|nr:hypothetical protein [bacterium]MDZ4299929.1 hypothetical protein [Candidatus Sungbacteria bacterium]
MKYGLLYKKTALLPFILFSGILLLWCRSAWAQTPSPVTFDNPLKAKDFPDLLAYVLAKIIPLALTVGVIAIIWAGFKMILAAAQGNSAGIQAARKMLGYVVLGIVIIAASATIAGALQQFLSGL